MASIVSKIMTSIASIAQTQPNTSPTLSAGEKAYLGAGERAYLDKTNADKTNPPCTKCQESTKCQGSFKDRLIALMGNRGSVRTGYELCHMKCLSILDWAFGSFTLCIYSNSNEKYQSFDKNKEGSKEERKAIKEMFWKIHCVRDITHKISYIVGMSIAATIVLRKLGF